MIIKETIERECCIFKDLQPYKGARAQKSLYPPKILVCKHCGQLWYWDRRMDAAGSMEDYLEKVLL